MKIQIDKLNDMDDFTDDDVNCCCVRDTCHPETCTCPIHK